jgi:hypothetical protein
VAFQYSLRLSAEQINSIQQAEELKSSLIINDINKNKKLKI